MKNSEARKLVGNFLLDNVKEWELDFLATPSLPGNISIQQFVGVVKEVAGELIDGVKKKRAKGDSATETREQILIRRVFKEIAPNHFNDHKLIGWYCGGVHFSRSLGDDLGTYIYAKNRDYYKTLERRESE